MNPRLVALSSNTHTCPDLNIDGANIEMETEFQPSHVGVAKFYGNKRELIDIGHGIKIPRQQRLNLLDGLCCWQVTQSTTQPGVGLQAIGLSCFDQRVNDGTSMSTSCRITE